MLEGDGEDVVGAAVGFVASWEGNKRVGDLKTVSNGDTM